MCRIARFSGFVSPAGAGSANPTGSPSVRTRPPAHGRRRVTSRHREQPGVPFASRLPASSPIAGAQPAEPAPVPGQRSLSRTTADHSIADTHPTESQRHQLGSVRLMPIVRYVGDRAGDSSSDARSGTMTCSSSAASTEPRARTPQRARSARRQVGERNGTISAARNWIREEEPGTRGAADDRSQKSRYHSNAVFVGRAPREALTVCRRCRGWRIRYPKAGKTVLQAACCLQ